MFLGNVFRDRDRRRMRPAAFLPFVLMFAGWAQSGNAGMILEFDQGGWSLGGPLRVSFQGEDSDGDGSLFLEELVHFEAFWITPEGGQAAWSLPDVVPDGFFFTNLDSYLLFAENSQFALVNVAFEGEAVASVFDESLFLVDSTTSLPTAVPEPSTFWLLGTGAVAILFGRWRRSRIRKHVPPGEDRPNY